MKKTHKKDSDENILFTYLIITANQALTSKITTGNTSDYTNFLETFKKILSSCSKNDHLRKILHQILNKVIIQGILKVLQKNQTQKHLHPKQLFVDEEVSRMTFNFHCLLDVVKCMLKWAPDIILNTKCYSHLISTLLLIPLSFRDGHAIRTKIYLTVYTLIYAKIRTRESENKRDLKLVEGENERKEEGMFVTEHGDLTRDLLQNGFLKKIFDHLPDKIELGTRLSDEQKIIYQIYYMLRTLELKNSEVESIYTYNNTLIDLEKSMIILQERTKFDLASYLSWPDKLERDTDEAENIIQTVANRYNHKFCSKHTFDKAVKIEVDVDPDSTFVDNSYILFSKDREGKIPYKLLETPDCTYKPFKIIGDSFYLHYPILKTRIECFGDQKSGRLGTGKKQYFSGHLTKMLD